MRNLCVTGWYYEEGFYDGLGELRDAGIQVFVMAHRPPTCRVPVPVVHLPDIGLEWGSYSTYLSRYWAGGETLFLHDDLAAPIEAIKNLYKARENNAVDLAHIFTDEAMAERDVWHHGRAIIASDKYLRLLKDGPGIWFDANNHGVTTGPGSNRGCHHFYFTMGALKEEDPTLRTTILIAPDIQFGYRGLMGEEGRAAAAERFVLQGASC